MRRDGPSALLLSRQNLPALSQHDAQVADIHRGAYVLLDWDGQLDAIVIATGSEVQLAIAAAQQLFQLKGMRVRVVSMPCCEQFLLQSSDYQQSVIPDAIRCRVAVEAASSAYWYRFVGLDGGVIGIDCFGVSAKASDAYNYLGITAEHIVEKLLERVGDLS